MKLADITVLTLELHLSRLQAATTFEEYRDAHCAYVQMLLDKHKAEVQGEKAIVDWMELNFKG